MIVEHAILEVPKEHTSAYEEKLREALPLISSTPGFVKLEVRPCIEIGGRYLLIVHWENLESHTTGFRQSQRYQEWRALLHGFYHPFPEVLHFDEAIVTA